MTERPMNFAVIGCGMLARNQHIPNIARSSKTVLHTCCDLNEAALQECREQHGALHTCTDFREAINDPEVEADRLATTETVRRTVIEAAAEVKKPVYVEKPIAASLDEVYRIRDVVKQAELPFCVGHNRRSGPAMIDAHRIFRAHMDDPKPCPWRYDREGAGRPERAEEGVAGMSVRINDDWHSWKAWAWDGCREGPMLFEMTHFTDLCNWFLAAEPAEVVALESGLLGHGVAIRYETGEMATIGMFGNGTFGYPKELYEMFGSGGAVVVDHLLEVRTAGIADAEPRTVYPMLQDHRPSVGAEGGLSGWLAKRRAACEEAAAQGDPSLGLVPQPNKGHQAHIERFVDEIRGEGPMVCGIDEAVAATRVAFAAIRAAHEKRAVTLEEV